MGTLAEDWEGCVAAARRHAIGDRKGDRFLLYADLVLAIGQAVKETGQRAGQAAYNLMVAAGQAGAPMWWPELFYRETCGFDEFEAEILDKFEIIDGYLVPR